MAKKKALTKREAAKPPAQASAARSVEPAKPAIGLADIEAVKDLLERVGTDSLKKLIDVMVR